MDVIQIKIHDENSSKYPAVFRWFVNSQRASVNWSNQTSSDALQKVASIDVFLDYVSAVFNQDIRIKDWGILKQQIRMLYEDRQQTEFTILSDRTLQE